jgi:hypothetical protein
MQCSTLLRRAAQCETDDDARKFADVLASEFHTTRALRGLSMLTNNEGYIEESREEPFVHVEFAQILSARFALSVCPEIHENQMGVIVQVLHFKDGFGMQSQDWEAFGGLENWIKAQDGESIAQLAKRAKEEALRQHAVLLTEVGLMPPAAIAAASKSWPKS